jgi:hypothetical protein
MIWVRVGLITLALGSLAAYFFVEVLRALKCGSLRTIQHNRTIVVLREKDPGFFYFKICTWILLGIGFIWGWFAAVRHIFK